uniref:Uncharacterized protein n=2 Tax=Palpitomonas bilix TaxID=652834 RepID=A0A7S3DLA4_9EUKA|mmetsp:Transcript_42105/g.108362  ORF Transcript_42105/g.108362 Transcript_42105/m.108362 type:complete len:205 (+) Transcript_42105:298-912(+)
MRCISETKESMPERDAFRQNGIQSALNSSDLARTLKEIFDSLRSCGQVHVCFNSWTSVSFLLNTKRDVSNTMMQAQTFGLYNIEETRSSLARKGDVSPALSRFVNSVHKLECKKKIDDVSLEIQASLRQTQLFAKHLRYFQHGEITQLVTRNDRFVVNPESCLVSSKSKRILFFRNCKRRCVKVTRQWPFSWNFLLSRKAMGKI